MQRIALLLGSAAVVCVAWVVPASATQASAATLGGVSSASLTASDLEGGAAAPVVLSCDDFSRSATTGSALVSRPVQVPAACGPGTWGVHLGTWTISSGRLAASGSNATATVPTLSATGVVGTVAMSAEAVIDGLNGGSREAGVAIDHTGTSRIYLSATIVNGSSVVLRLVNGSTLTTLASAGVVPTASTTLRLSRSGNTVSVSVNGVTALTHVLSSARVSTLAGGTRAGLVWRSGSTVRFVRLVVTSAG